MKLIKPAWVCHEGQPIFSVDVHPLGGKFATGGQGEDCGRVTVWNLAPIINPKLQKDNKVPKMLCQMDNHLACVNAVRWSGSGKYLASGGDDQRIILWTKSAYAGGAVFGGGGKINHENYKVAYTLRIHDGDVLDLAWSPGDVWLASASVDNTIIVWDVQNLPQTVAILKGHSGHVKGVTWDPVGKYLASQSADKTVRVWRTSDWGEEAKVSEPFEECGGTTHVLRLDWSPDGQYLVSAHAMNGGGPTAQILDREGWRYEKDFVGHRKAVTCVRFNDNIFEKYLAGVGKKAQYVCLAIGSRDRSLSVWLTSLKRPLFVIHDVFESSILDLTWSKDGMVLIACSMDGNIAAVVLNEAELGTPMAKDAKNNVLKKIYGQNIGITNSPKKTLIENPELLKLQNGVDFKDDDGEEPKVAGVGAGNQGAVKGPTDKQIEMRTSDGKRRITPIYIMPNAADSSNSASVNGNSMCSESVGKYQMQSSSSESKSKIRIEKVDGVVEPNVSPGKKSNTDKVATPPLPKPNMIAIKHKPGPVNNSNPAIVSTANATTTSSMSSKTTTTTASTTSTATTTDSSDSAAPKVNVIPIRKAPKKDESKDDTESTAKMNGTDKKRVNRIESSSSESDSSDSVSSSSSDDETASQTSKSGAETAASATEKDKADKEKSKSKPSTESEASPPKPGILVKKRKADSPVVDAAPPKKRGRPPGTPGNSTPVQSKTATAPTAAQIQAALPIPQQTAPTVQQSAPKPTFRGLAPLALTNNRGNCYCCQLTVSGTVLHLTVENNHSKTPVGMVHLVTAASSPTAGSPPVWELLLHSPIVSLVSANSHLLIACRDASMHLMEAEGSRALPPFTLPSPPHRIQCVSSRLLVCVTVSCRLYSWSLSAGLPRAELSNEEVGPLLRSNLPNISINNISLNPTNNATQEQQHQPTLSLSDGSVHTTCPTLGAGCWLTLVPPRCSPSSLLPPCPLSLASQPLARLANTQPLSVKMEQKLEGRCNSSNIESKLRASLYLGSPSEYRYWLGALVKSLAKQGAEQRIRNILDDLLGPGTSKTSKTFNGNSQDSWSSTTLGLSKQTLLSEVLPHVASNLCLQRLYSEYKAQLQPGAQDLFN